MRYNAESIRPGIVFRALCFLGVEMLVISFLLRNKEVRA